MQKHAFWFDRTHWVSSIPNETRKANPIQAIVMVKFSRKDAEEEAKAQFFFAALRLCFAPLRETLFRIKGVRDDGYTSTRNSDDHLNLPGR